MYLDLSMVTDYAVSEAPLGAEMVIEPQTHKTPLMGLRSSHLSK